METKDARTMASRGRREGRGGTGVEESGTDAWGGGLICE